MELKNCSMKKFNDSNFLFFTEENYLVYYNIDTEEYFVLEHDKKILYTWDYYYSDSGKNIYEVDTRKFETPKEKRPIENKVNIRRLRSLLDEPSRTFFFKHQEVTKFLRKIKKNLFKATGNYLIDTFGDCMINGDKKLTGTLCGVVDCCSTSKFIILADKYKRIRIVDSQGKIMRFIFVSSHIIKTVCTEERLFVLTKESFEIFDIKSGVQLNNKKMNNSERDNLLIVNDKVYFVKESNLYDIEQNIIKKDGVFVSNQETIFTLKVC